MWPPPMCAPSGRPRGEGVSLVAVGRGGVGAGAWGEALSPPPALLRGDAIGGGVVCCRWCATEGLLGGAAAARLRRLLFFRHR